MTTGTTLRPNCLFPKKMFTNHSLSIYTFLEPYIDFPTANCISFIIAT